MLCVLASMLAGILEGSAALKPNFAHTVLRAVCRRAMTKMEGLNDFNSERCLRPSSRRTQILYPAMPIKWTFTAGRRALHVKAHHLFHPPHPTPLPSLSWTLQDGRWVKETRMSSSLRNTDEPSTWFRCLSTLGCAVAQLSGQTATDSCCQLELLEPHSLRHLPQRSSLLHL